MPGRDMTDVHLAAPPWEMALYHEVGTTSDGQMIWPGDKVRVDGRQGVHEFVSHRDHPREQAFMVRGPDGVRPVAVDKVKVAKR